VAVRSVMDAVSTCGRGCEQTYSCGNTSQAKDGSKAEVKLPCTSLEIRCQSDVKFVVSESVVSDVFMCLAGALQTGKGGAYPSHADCCKPVPRQRVKNT
jgi:hypothetical protein